MPSTVQEIQLALIGMSNSTKARFEDFIISGKKSKGEVKTSEKSLKQKATGFVKDMFF